MNAWLVRSDARFIPLRDESVDCVVTSPPYWGLRDYGCAGQIGIEADPVSYVASVVAAPEECRRVLRPAGVAWLNLGDSYAGSWSGNSMRPGGGTQRPGGPGFQELDARYPARGGAVPSGQKPKDLVGVPWRVAFALQAAGWWLRCDIVWAKPNPMPESVTDRPTRSHEYVFLLAKSERYWYDADAIREDFSEGTYLRLNQGTFSMQTGGPKDYGRTGRGLHSARRALENLHRKFEGPGFTEASAGDPPHRGLDLSRRQWRAKTAGPGPHAGGRRQAPEPGEPGAFHPNGRNARSVWTIATQPYSGAHFATFPEELARRCILAGCPVGGTVLDPFAGSGTVGKVAIETGRSAVLCDLAYQDLARRRIVNVQRPLSMVPA